jgi:DNA-nicking Smr family endonuclease
MVKATKQAKHAKPARVRDQRIDDAAHANTRTPSADDDLLAFAEAVRGARPLGGARRVLPSANTIAVRVPTPANLLPNSGPLAIEDAGPDWTARASGVDRRVLRRMRSGDLAVDGKIDLHGLSRARAGDALDRFFAQARAAGSRCLLVIHGRGLHSGEDGAALRDVVRAYLTTGPLAALVLACATAPTKRGGDGATLVFLRR